MKVLALVALVCGLLLSASLATPSSQAAPSLQLPWPSGAQHRINGGYTYGCGTHSNTTRNYYAIDFVFAVGDAVSATSGGTIIDGHSDPNTADDRGNFLEIDHGGGYHSRYLHLRSDSPWAPGIQIGSPVTQGQLIAYSGDTGHVEAHLHFDMQYYDQNGSHAYEAEPMSGVSGFSYYGYSVFNSGSCYSDPNDPSPYWTSAPPATPTPTPSPTPSPTPTPPPCVTPTPPYEDGSLWQMEGDTAVYTFLGQTKYWIQTPQNLTDMLAAGVVHNPVHCATAHSLDSIPSIPQDKTLIEEFGSTDIYVVDCAGKFLTPTLGVVINMINNGYAGSTIYIIPPHDTEDIPNEPNEGCPLRETPAGPNYITCQFIHAKWAMSSYAQTRMGHQSDMLTLWPAGQGYTGALSGFNTLSPTSLKVCTDSDGDGWSDLSEFFMGTDPNHSCAVNPTPNNEPPPDRWPVDFDDSQKLDLTDVLKFHPSSMRTPLVRRTIRVST